MNVYKRRYINALKKCAKGNRLLKKGYILTDSNGTVLKGPFYLSDDSLLLQASNNCSYIIFINDTDLDNGMNTKIEDFNAELRKEYSFIPKESIITLWE